MPNTQTTLDQITCFNALSAILYQLLEHPALIWEKNQTISLTLIPIPEIAENFLQANSLYTARRIFVVSKVLYHLAAELPCSCIQVQSKKYCAVHLSSYL